jgi:hypothetical protein
MTIASVGDLISNSISSTHMLRLCGPGHAEKLSMSMGSVAPRHVILTLATVWLAAGQTSLAATLETLTPRPGVTEQFALLPAEDGPAKASVILFVGGDGRVGLRPDNLDQRFGNFLARTRGLFAAQGLQVALLDSPSDHRQLGSWRVSADHAKDIAAVIRFLRAKANVPVWLVGTSRGTVSAAVAAGRLAGAPPDSRPDGIVLTSSISVPSRVEPTTVYDTDFDAVRVPVLIVAHKDDRCKVSPASAAPRLARAFSHASKIETMIFEGGDPPRSDPCMPFAQHGYLGIEAKVVTAIANWIKASGRR